MKHHPVSQWLKVAPILASAPFCFAQGASSSGGSALPSTNETVTLSPFEVNATLDTGYAGQDTLSGSRLRTNLKDVAAAISPMTAEFLRDIAATNIADAVEYGVGT